MDTLLNTSTRVQRNRPPPFWITDQLSLGSRNDESYPLLSRNFNNTSN